jgi:hypothetical protein
LAADSAFRLISIEDKDCTSGNLQPTPLGYSMYWIKKKALYQLPSCFGFATRKGATETRDDFKVSLRTAKRQGLSMNFLQRQETEMGFP